MPRVSVIIVNYNSGGRLENCLEHLAAQTFGDFETIVVDNGSSDGSASLVGSQATLIRCGENIGFAAANNRAARAARGSLLAFLNPDAYADNTWLAELIAASERFPGAGAFGSTQLNAGDPSKIDGAGDAFFVLGLPYRGHFGWSASSLPPEGECFSACAAAAMYRREAFELLGGFDERFFCYGEDVDLGFRLRLAGGSAVQVRNARVLHEGSGVTGRRSDFTVYHGHRNRIWTTYKNMPGIFYWPLAPGRFLLDFALLLRSVFSGTARPYCRALIDGYGGLSKLREDRRGLLARRRVSLRELARAMTWRPDQALMRKAKPIRRQVASHALKKVTRR